MTQSKAGVRPFEASTNGGASGETTMAEVVRAKPPVARSSSSHTSCEFLFLYKRLCELLLINFLSFSLYSRQQKTKNGAINAENDEVNKEPLS